jgi:predicted metal-dependent peptidase
MSRTIRAKVKLLLSHPFYASLLMKLNVVETTDIPTACTDGVTLKINPDFWDGLNIDEQQGLLAHEVLHPAFLHHTRRNDRDPFVWNMACDYAINPILKDGGLTLPQGALIDAKYSGKSADEIYNDIYQNAVKMKQKGFGSGANGEWQEGDGFSGGIGDVEDFHDGEGRDGAATTMEEQEQLQRIIAAHQVAKEAGKAPKGIDRFIEERLNPKVNWKDALEQIVSEKTFDDYTWTKPNRRFLGSCFYLPALEDESVGEIAFMCDTSGSINQTQLNTFSAECNSIGEIIKSRKTAIYCDSKIAGIDVFDPDEDVALRFKGGGGTDFRPPFKWLEDNEVEPKIAIYFTDGYCDDFPKAVPDYPVIWAIYNGVDKFKPPFGDVIYIPKDAL